MRKVRHLCCVTFVPRLSSQSASLLLICESLIQQSRISSAFSVQQSCQVDRFSIYISGISMQRRTSRIGYDVSIRMKKVRQSAHLMVASWNFQITQVERTTSDHITIKSTRHVKKLIVVVKLCRTVIKEVLIVVTCVQLPIERQLIY